MIWKPSHGEKEKDDRGAESTAGKERESVIAKKEEWGMVTGMDGG